MSTPGWTLPKGYLRCACGEGAVRKPAPCPVCGEPIRAAQPEAPAIEPWTRTFVVAYDQALSKNRRSGWRDGTRYTPRDTVAAREQLEFELRIHLRDAPVVKGRLHLDLLCIWNDGRRRDCLNALDEFADCVSRVVGVDDRWFSACVDWKLDPDAESNRVRVTISQG